MRGVSKAAAVKEAGNSAAISSFMESTSREDSATDYLEYDSSIGMLRVKSVSIFIVTRQKIYGT